MNSIRCSGRHRYGLLRCNTIVKVESDKNGKVWCGRHIGQKYSKQVIKKTVTPLRSPQPECSICLDPIRSKNKANLRCGHDFHIGCVKKLHNPTCPVCRVELKSKKLNCNDLKNMTDKQSEDLETFQAEDSEAFQAEDSEAVHIGSLESFYVEVSHEDTATFEVFIESYHGDDTALINKTKRAYLDMLESLKSNLPECVEERIDYTSMIVRLVAVVMLTGLTRIHVEPRSLHDVLLHDIPPLFPSVNIEEICMFIRCILGSATSLRLNVIPILCVSAQIE